MENNPFYIPYDYFKNDVYPVNEYVKQMETYLQKKYHLSKEESKIKLKEILKQHDIKIPEARFYFKLPNGDMVEKKDKLTNYIKESIDDKEIIVPSFTTYYPPEKQKSIHSEFMAYNTKRRSLHKKAAFKAKQDGDMDKFITNDVLQKTMKIFNNSLSGAYASKSTVLRNPSAHYTLTSMTRCVSSIGNALTESVVYGNKHFKDKETTLNYITTVITNIRRVDVDYCIKKYKLHIPTPEEVFEMVFNSSKWYWRDEASEQDILNYIKCLDDIDRVALMYTNDMWHLKQYNEKLIRILFNLTLKKCDDITGDTSINKSIPETLEILVKLICYEELKGKNINYDELKDTDLGKLLASTATNVLKVFRTFSRLFKTFFFTNIMPPTIAYIKDMFRECIVLSDTDSTCGTYGKWVEWYLGKISFKDDAIPIAGIMVTIVSQCVDHGLKILSKNMNLPDERMEILKMKNEFIWPVFIVTNKNKHYFANVAVQEGNVFKEHDLELKGVHLIASAADQVISKKVHNMIKEINSTLCKNEKISVTHYVEYVKSLEKEIIDRINQKDITIFKKDSIKEAKAYKQEVKLSPYLNHLLWEDIFKEKYGEVGNPPYVTVKVPTTLDSLKKMQEWLLTIEDESMRQKFEEFMAKYDKKYFGTFRIPYTIASSNGIPEEILNIVDKKRIVIDNLNSAYLVLESIGYYKKNNEIISIDIL